MPKLKPVIVTTEFRGVFFGFLEKRDDTNVVLKNARNIIYWSGSRGFLGLAKHGPEPSSRIGSTVDCIELIKMTSITDCSKDAVESFTKWPDL